MVELLNDADQHVTDGNEQPVAWPAALAGDKGYRADGINDALLEVGIKPVIPSKSNEDRTKRKIEFDQPAYRDRNIIERLFGWLKESRRIFARFEKTAKNRFMRPFGGLSFKRRTCWSLLELCYRGTIPAGSAVCPQRHCIVRWD